MANLLFQVFGEKVWQINRSAKKLLIVNIDLNGFSLVNHGWLTKFAKLYPTKLSCFMALYLYMTIVYTCVSLNSSLHCAILSQNHITHLVNYSHIYRWKICIIYHQRVMVIFLTSYVAIFSKDNKMEILNKEN